MEQVIKHLTEIHGIKEQDAADLVKAHPHIVDQGLQQIADRLAVITRDSDPTEPVERVERQDIRKGWDAFPNQAEKKK